MTRILKTTLLVCIVSCGTGCTTGYWIDRGRDTADVFTLGVNYGFGAKVRMSAVHVITPIVHNQATYCGLKGGELFVSERPPDNSDSLAVLGMVRREKFTGGPLALERRKAYDIEWFVIAGLDNSSLPDKESGLSFYTDIEVQVACGIGLRAGFNPGELLDFFLGWFGVDPFNDDLERRKQKVIEQGNAPDGSRRGGFGAYKRRLYA